MLVHSRFAIGALVCSLMILCITVRGETSTAQIHYAVASVGSITLITDIQLAQLSQTGFRLRGIADWLISSVSSNLAEDRKISILGNHGNFDLSQAPRAPDFCFWNAQSFPASKQTMIRLYGNPRIGSRPFGSGFHFQSGWQLATQEDMEEDLSRARGKADVLSIPWGPWILQ